MFLFRYYFLLAIFVEISDYCCLQYVIGAIFRDIHLWSATGETSAGGSSYYSAVSGGGGSPGQALATLPTSVGVVADFYVGLGSQVYWL